MKEFWNDLPAVNPRIKASKLIVLFLDFDGTLSPIVDDPMKAKLPPKTAETIFMLSHRTNFRIAVVSGRQLEDVIQRVDISSVDYCGNHGYRWLIRGKLDAKPESGDFSDVKPKILQIFRQLTDLYPSLIIEDKGIAVSLHYRRLGKSKQKSFQSDFTKLTAPLTKTPVKFMKNKMVYEYSLNIPWSKGDFCTMYIEGIRSEISDDILPIYLGDDSTDETAFSVLRHGLTIRIEPEEHSLARYYLAQQTEVQTFLDYLV